MPLRTRRVRAQRRAQCERRYAPRFDTLPPPFFAAFHASFALLTRDACRC
jgi:hypothetical protein